MMNIIKCTQCNNWGGTVPKHYWDGVTEMMHEACAVKHIEAYFDRKNKEVSP